MSLTTTYQSCKLQVGSQCPGIKRILSLILRTLSGSAIIPCSSEHFIYSNSEFVVFGKPLSTAIDFSPASTTACFCNAFDITPVRMNKEFSKLLELFNFLSCFKDE